MKPVGGVPKGPLTRRALAVTRLAAIVALAVSTVVVLGGCGSHSSVVSDHREVRTFVLDAASFEAIDIDSEKGRIDIAPHGTELPRWALAELDRAGNAGGGGMLDDSSSAVIVAVVQSDKKDRVAEATLEPRVEAGTLHLKAGWPFAISDDNGDGVEYAIRLPAVGAFEAGERVRRHQRAGGNGFLQHRLGLRGYHADGAAGAGGRGHGVR
jgi:hypothetical protein